MGSDYYSKRIKHIGSVIRPGRTIPKLLLLPDSWVLFPRPPPITPSTCSHYSLDLPPLLPRPPPITPSTSSHYSLDLPPLLPRPPPITPSTSSHYSLNLLPLFPCQFTPLPKKYFWLNFQHMTVYNTKTPDSSDCSMKRSYFVYRRNSYCQTRMIHHNSMR